MATKETSKTANKETAKTAKFANKETAKTAKVANQETAKTAKFANQETATPVEIVVTGTKNAAGDIMVNIADVIKVNANKAKEYGMERFHHVVKVPKTNKGLIYVWDTREIVGIIDIDSISTDDLNKNVKDSGSELKVTKNTPDEVAKLLK